MILPREHSRARVCAFNIMYALWTLAIALAWIPILVFAPVTVQRTGRPWALGARFLARKMLGIELRFEGMQYCQQTQVIYAVKHQSALDILAILSLLETPVFILKRELLFLPFYGLYLWRMKMVAINRKGGARAMKIMIRQCKEALHSRRPIIVFPEGTRVPAGETGTFHPGIAALYDAMKVPVIPVALNCGMLWPKTSLIKRPGTATVKLLPPIPPGLPPKQFLKELKKTIETESNALLSASFESASAS